MVNREWVKGKNLSPAKAGFHPQIFIVDPGLKAWAIVNRPLRRTMGHPLPQVVLTMLTRTEPTRYEGALTRRSDPYRFRKIYLAVDI